MSKKILILALGAVLALTGCSADSKNSVSAITSRDTATTEATAYVGTSAEEQTISEFIEISSNHAEIMQLGNTLAEKLQALFMDYLQYELEKTKLETSDKTVISDWNECEFPFNKIENENITCLDDLKKIFSTVCTEKYTDELLTTDVSHLFKDIDGSLYVCDTTFCFPPLVINAYLSGYRENGDTIEFILVKQSGEYDPELDEMVHNSEWDSTFTMTAVSVNGNWLINSCDDIAAVGYCYNSN